MLVDVLQVAEEYLKILICVVEEHKENPVCHTLVPHIDEKAIDDAEQATCIVEDSSPPLIIPLLELHIHCQL